MLSGTRLAVGAGAILAIASCARDRRAAEHPVAAEAPPEQQSAPAAPRGARLPAAPLNRRAMMAVGDAAYEAWIAKVRACTPADAARAKPYLPGLQADLAKRRPAVSILGRLVPINPDCLLIGCDAQPPCCNGCTVEWVVAPRRDCPGRKLRIRLAGSPSALTGGGMDCAVFGYAQDADWVIVAGRIDGPGNIVVDADLCRPSSKMVEGEDQLSNADYERLASPATKRRMADDDANCAPSPAPQAVPRPQP